MQTKPVEGVKHLFEPIPVENRLPKKWSKIRAWAAENAYTLILLGLLNVVTWVLIIIDIYTKRR